MSRRRAIGFWVLGAICIFIGCILAGSLELTADITTGLIIAYIISFLLILVGGMFWISVSIAQFE